jgi:hydroxylaminobenzene mutase
MRPDRVLLRAGFLLVLFALFTGFAIPAFRNQHMAVSVHVSGVLNGLLLVAFAVAWESLRQGPGRARLVRGLALYGTYANWVGGVLGASWGTSRLTPQAGAGFHALPWQEAVVQTLQVTLALAIAGAVLLAILSLGPERGKATVAVAAPAS